MGFVFRGGNVVFIGDECCASSSFCRFVGGPRADHAFLAAFAAAEFWLGLKTCAFPPSCLHFLVVSIISSWFDGEAGRLVCWWLVIVLVRLFILVV